MDVAGLYALVRQLDASGRLTTSRIATATGYDYVLLAAVAGAIEQDSQQPMISTVDGRIYATFDGAITAFRSLGLLGPVREALALALDRQDSQPHGKQAAENPRS